MPAIQSLLVFAVVVLVACATPASRFEEQKHGIVAGAVVVKVPEDIGLHQVQLVARKEGTLLSDAINLYLQPGEEHIYTAILEDGEYAFTALRVDTGGVQYLQQETPLPLSFRVTKGQVSRLGRLEIVLTSKDGLIGRIVGETVQLLGDKGDTDALDTAVAEAYPSLPDMPTSNQSLLDSPASIRLQLESEEQQGRSLFSF